MHSHALNSSTVIIVHPFSFPFRSRAGDLPHRFAFAKFKFRSCPSNPRPLGRNANESLLPSVSLLFPRRRRFNLTRLQNFFSPAGVSRVQLRLIFSSHFTGPTRERFYSWMKKTRDTARARYRRSGGSRDRVAKSRKTTAALYPRGSRLG